MGQRAEIEFVRTEPWKPEEFIALGRARLAYHWPRGHACRRVFLPGRRAVTLAQLEVMAHEYGASLVMPASIHYAQSAELRALRRRDAKGGDGCEEEGQGQAEGQAVLSAASQ